MNTEEYQRAITHTLMSDKTIHPLHITPQLAWPLSVIIRLAARHPSRNEWGKKADMAIAKKIEKPIRARHPLPDVYRVEHLLPIMEDTEIVEISLTMAELWQIVGAVHLAARHVQAQGGESLRLATVAAKQIEGRIVEYHPDAWLMIQMSWDERYDE